MADTRSQARIGLVSVSDRASRGEYEDRSGPAMQSWLEGVLTSSWEPVFRLIPDEPDLVKSTLIELADEEGCDLVITAGGTGPAPRDITPEATEAVCTRLLPGFGEEMRRASLAEVPTAILSRQLAGIRGSCLLLNLPGSPRAVSTCLQAVFAAIPDCVDLIGGARLETDPEKIRAFRPHS